MKAFLLTSPFQVMIYFLDIILLLNLIWAYNYFRSIVAPPVLFGLGMLLASIIASCYYEEWGLYTLLVETILIFASSPVLFTFLCVCMHDRFIVREGVKKVQFSFYLTRSINALLFTVILGICGIILTYAFYVGRFGSHLSIPELLFQARLHLMSGELQIPLLVRLADLINGLVSYFSSWGISFYIITRRKKDKLFSLMILQLIVTSILGLGSGSKGEFADPIMRFAIILLILRYTNCPLNISQKSIVKFICGMALAFFCFVQINSFIGRSTDDYHSGLDLVAEYCGAQIKNFDTFLKNENALKYSDSGHVGEQTFLSLYNDIGIDDVRYVGTFEYYKKYRLGNVYSIYLPLYKDFGIVGLYLMVAIIAFLSMYLYKCSILMNSRDLVPNVSTFIYSSIGFPLFMSFFSNRFSERFFRIGMIRNAIIFWFAIYLFKRYILKKRNIIVV